MLKYRLLFGIIMTIVLIGIVLLDARLDGSLYGSPNGRPQATLLMVLLVLLAAPAQREIGRLFRKVGIVPFYLVTIPATILLGTLFYWRHFAKDPAWFTFYYLLFGLAGSLLALFFVQALRRGTVGTILNCGGGILSILYIGLLSSFILALRIDFGPWVLLTFIFTVKSADIGAYFTGRKLGKHKMAPLISPGKTWEGLAGGVVLSAIVACVFSRVFGIMNIMNAIVFGAVFAVLGQMGDLAESMIKRDAAAKDASQAIPGFGGILDVIDSPLATAPIAYAVFLLMNR
jgi:phosphatidate cytidylyltransferase